MAKQPPLEPESTHDLVERARGGDEDAVNRIVARVIPQLRRYARGRLPPYARSIHDTESIVQDTVAKAFRLFGQIELHHSGALLAYLRRAIANRITDEVRRARREPAPTKRTKPTRLVAEE